MILRLLSLGTEMTPKIREAQGAISGAFGSILDEKFSFKNFGSEKEFLAELSEAVAKDHMIVLCAEPALFSAFKGFVCKSFQLKCRYNKQIMKLVSESHPEISEEDLEKESYMPVNATPLPSKDGICSGFAVKAKKQLLLVLPLDDIRIDYIINAGVYPYVRANMDMSVLIADPLKDVSPVKSVLNKNAEPVAMYDVQSIKSTVKKLSERGLTVAVANTKTVDFLGNISMTSVDLSKTVFVSPYTAEKGDMPAREYAINLAKGALANSTNSVGAAITKVFSTKNDEGKPQFFMYVCIVDKENANVAKLVAEKDDTPPKLIYKAIEEIFKMLDLWSDTGYATPQFTDESVVRRTVEANDADKKNKLIQYVVSGLIAASFAVSIGVSLFFENVYGVM